MSTDDSAKTGRDEPRPYVIPLSEDGFEALSFAPIRFSGWAAYFSGRAGGMRVFLRVGPRMPDGDLPRPAEAAPLEIKELSVAGDGGAAIRSGHMKLFPWERIEAAINRPLHRAVLIGYVQPWNAVRDDFPERRHRGWLAPPDGPVPNPAPPLRIMEGPRYQARPDSFYADVADRFLWLATTSKNAAQELATANDVPTTTVYGWVREAKERGLLTLPPRA